MTSLRNIVWERNWRLDILITCSERQIDKLYLEDTHISILKMLFVSFIEQMVLPIVFFIVQGCFHLFLCFEPWIVQRGMTDDMIFLLKFLGEHHALVTELNHWFASGHLLQQLRGQFGGSIGIDGQCHEPSQLLDDLIRGMAQEGSNSIELNLLIEVVPDHVQLVIENLILH